MPGADIDWSAVERVLVIRLRSIGDTVLATPTLTALRRHLPSARIDILLEDWVAPLLSGHRSIDRVMTTGTTLAERTRAALRLRRERYDVVINLHGGTTSTFFTRAAGAPVRAGYSNYRYAFLYTHLLDSSADFWERSPTHSVEQQLALAGSLGVPVDPDIPTSLSIDADAESSVLGRLAATRNGGKPFALVHPAAAFETKQWAADKFARAVEYLDSRGLAAVAVAGPGEQAVLDRLTELSKVPVTAFSDLSLPEITALASNARVFVGNDSGIAHIAAAVGTPPLVIFGSSNRDHWRPWTPGPSEIVFDEYPCQPCPGYECAVFGDSRCIRDVSVDEVIKALDRLI
jgi:lipopolysaccharide heptosyltransferase II